MSLETGNSHPIKGLFFDLCGTLLVYGNMDQAWEEWLETAYACFKKSGLNLTLEQFGQACDGLFSRPEPELEKDGLTVYERRLKRLCRQIGQDMSDQDLQTAAMSTVRTWADRMYLDPDCLAVLETLCQKQKLALITNFDHPPYIQMALHSHRLKGFFSEVLISSEVGLKKPDSAIFHLGLARSGLRAAEVMHIGDSLEDDVKGARAAGIRPVFISRDPAATAAAYDYKAGHKNQVLPDNSQTVAVHTIRRLTELLDLI